MQRIRIVFVVLAVVLVVTLGLLVSQALVSVETERDLRHRLVAERAFDEMERELNAFLRREEERPFEHYRDLYLPESGGTATRSPLADPPQEDFIVGYFQMDPDGSLSSPAQSQNEKLQALMGRQWDNAAFRESPVTHPTQSPGTTVILSEKKKKQVDFDDYSPQTALSQLNRAAAEREQQQQATKQSMLSKVYDFTGRRAREAASAQPAAKDAFDPNLDEEVMEAVNVDLEPMVGRLADSDHLLIYRTVLIDQNAYRQGLVLHIPRLVEWLSAQVLVAGGLSAHAQVIWVEEAGSLAESPGQYLFRHRFAEPFAQVTGVLTLDPLPDDGGARYIYLLSALLALVATLGLIAVYRMVAVTVGFANRRYNFVSAVTHELKTPLTAIRMYGEMLRDGVVASKEKRQHYYRVITAETERLTRLVNNVLELARLERKDRSLSLVVGDIEPVLEEVVAILEPHAQQEAFRLRVEVEESLPPVRFDRDALTQVLFNLVDNAIKYSRQAEKKEILLSCRRHETGVVLAIADYGPGVPPRHLRRIFEPFYRGEDELTRTSKGTGIGLALVRGLVERMGGSVSGHNREAGGFVVSVSLRSATA